MRRFRRPGRAVRRILNRGIRRNLRTGSPAARLRSAHQAMANGEFELAEAEFLGLAEAAQRRGLPQGATLLITAGMAAVEAGEADRGAEYVLRGLREFRQRGQLRRLAQAARRVAGELRSKGHDRVADRIESEFFGAELELPAQPEPAEMAESLPAKCPQCGGGVHPGEVEWADDRRAICDYCGSILTASS